LVRKILFKDHQLELDEKTINQILEPTKIYVKPILHVLSKIRIKGIAHITGGGFDENIPRALPDDLGAIIDTTAFLRPDIYHTLKRLSNMSDREMFQVFNMGIGMVVIVDAKDASQAIERFKEMGENASVMGTISKQKGLTFLW